MTESIDTQPPVHPKWHPHDDPRYDSLLVSACASELDRLRKATSKERLSFINDPREVHVRLYKDLAPIGNPEYAGTYRGTPDTSLFDRKTGAVRISDGEEFQFCTPSKVSTRLAEFQQEAEILFNESGVLTATQYLVKAAYLFYFFGYVHPFLDGNGHIQRLMFAACVFERPDINLMQNWTIHPRPYGEEFAIALDSLPPQLAVTNLTKQLLNYVQINF